MKIIVVASSIIPGKSLGIEHFTYRLVNALSEYHPQHQYIVLIPTGTLNAWLARVPQKDNLTFVPMGFSPTIRGRISTKQSGLSDRFYRFLKEQKIFRLIFRNLKQFELRQTIRRQKPDIVYSPLHVEALVFGNWKTIITVHDLREIMPEFYDEERARSLQENIAKSHGIVIAWQHPFDQLREKFPRYKAKTYLIPFPIPIARIESSSAAPDQCEKEIILYASALREQKNHINLIRSMPEIIRARSLEKKDVLLVCAGTCHDPLHKELIQEVSRLGIEENVLFTGFISDAELSQWYERSTMVVSPTLWEAASGAVFEGFSFQKPISCSRIPPIISQVEQSSGFVNYFDPHDPHDIARSVLEVLRNPVPYVEGAIRGAQFLNGLTWEKTAHQYMQIFRQVDESNSL